MGGLLLACGLLAGSPARGARLAELRGAARPPPAAHPRAPAAILPDVSYPPTQGCTTPLTYCGGPIVASPEIVQVSWDDPGPGGAVASSVESYLQAWWPAILGQEAGYLAWLTEYGTAGRNGDDGLPGSNQAFSGLGTYLGLYRITPSPQNQGALLDDTAIREELAAQITAGHLPAPDCDASGRCNTLYMIDLPPSVTAATLTFGGKTEQSCASFCGYHMGTTVGGDTIGYGVFPDLTSACPGCAPDGLEQDLGTLHSHEVVEAITDPDLFLEALTPTSTDCMRPGAWDQLAPGCGEIGDSCAWPTVIPSVTVAGRSYFVQGLFDNARMDCETAGPTRTCATSADCPSPTPICDPSGHTCRACLPSDCAGATPACATSGPHAGTCVACAADSDCDSHLNAPICDATTNLCRPCVATDCVALTPVCAASGVYAGRCVECTSSADCSPPTPSCDLATYTCAACDAGCEGAGDSGDADVADAADEDGAQDAHDADDAGDAGDDADASGVVARPVATSGPSATGSGCQVGAGPRGEGSASALVALVAVASALAATARRRRRHRQGR